MSQLVWFITGCSSGLGRTLALTALARGDKVIATARGPLDRLKPLEEAGTTILELDVTSSQEVLNQSVEKAIKVYGRIDVLVPNAGYAESTYLEGISAETWNKQLDVNFYGVTNLVNAVLPHFRSRRSGTIAFMSSVSAYVTFPGGGPYTVSKQAMNGYSKTLLKEVQIFGIRPILFELGHIRTPFPKNIKVTAPDIKDYVPIFMVCSEWNEEIPDNQPGSPENCASRIIDVVKVEGLASNKATPAIVPLGSDAYLTIKNYAESLIRACEEWEELSRSVDYPEPRKGPYADLEYYW